MPAIPASRSSFPLPAACSLLRPLNILIAVLGVGVGALLGGDAAARSAVPDLLLAMLSVAALVGGANAWNDALDVEADSVNRPARPLPSGRVSRRFAVVLGASATLIGVAASLGVSMLHFGVAIAMALVLWGYNARLKRIPLLGNLIVSAAVAGTLLYGAWVVGPTGPAWVGAAFALLTTLTREIIKDVEDEEGDAVQGIRSLPVLLGMRSTRTLLLALIGVTVALTPFPYLFLDVGARFLAPVLAADAGLLAAAWSIVYPDRLTADAARAGSARLKLAMLAGLVALALA